MAKYFHLFCAVLIINFVAIYWYFGYVVSATPMKKWTNSIPNDAYILQSDYLPRSPQYYPTIANGLLGMKLFGDSIYVSGIYNGRNGGSHRARIPSNVIPYILCPNITKDNARFLQDMEKGIFRISQENANYKWKETFYAPLYSKILVQEIELIFYRPGVYQLKLYTWGNSDSNDFDITATKNLNFSPSICMSEMCRFSLHSKYRSGKTRISEEIFSQTSAIHIISTTIPDEFELNISEEDINSAKTFVFVSSIGLSYEEAYTNYESALKNTENLRKKHENEWKKRWQSSNISISSIDNTNQVVTSSLYYILSNFPLSEEKFKFHGVSPGGLTNGGDGQDYFGHIFWDQDFWIAPALLPLYPDLVKQVILYRVSGLKPALDKAKKFGYEGAMYPWEAAHTGYDVCPGMSYIKLEIHVTADIVHLLKQYVYATNNWTFLKNKSVWLMLREIATFFESRVDFNTTLNSYVINNVMGPDEWNSPVNNSVFTNVAARNVLDFAAEVAFKLKYDEEQALKWKEIASKMYIPLQNYPKVGHYHPEFDGFDPEKTEVKQADAIMLGFPLMLKMSVDEQRNDLNVYAKATTEEGPAMTWGMFAINYLKVNDPKKADEMYLKQLKNIHKPFLIWSEQADGSGATNFLTGIGAYLQSIFYGYLGIRYLPHKMVLKPSLPPFDAHKGGNEIVLHGLKYKGNSFSIAVDESYVVITLNTLADFSKCVSIFSNYTTYKLCKPNDTLHLMRMPFEIY